MKNRMFLIAAGVLLLIAAIYFPLVHADTIKFGNISDLCSGEQSSNIGSWSDEIWQASDFFQLIPEKDTVGKNDDMNFVYTPIPDPAPPHTKTLFPLDPTNFKRDKSGIQMDLMIIGWSTSGHMHFASGL